MGELSLIETGLLLKYIFCTKGNSVPCNPANIIFCAHVLEIEKISVGRIMFTFFRRIRKALVDDDGPSIANGPSSPKRRSVERGVSAGTFAASDGRTKKYLLYAIGEIALVVIGILIALQINNWNEWRKDRLEEKKLLMELKTDLTSNLEELKDGIQIHQLGVQATEKVRNHIDSKLPVSDSLFTDFYLLQIMDYFFPILGSYESLKSSGLSIIQDDSIRIQITNVYDLSFERIVQKDKNQRRNPEMLFSSYFEQNFLIKESDLWVVAGVRKSARAIPINYDTLMNDPQFKTLLFMSMRGRSNLLANYKRCEKSVLKLIEDLNNYLLVNNKV